MTTCACKVVNDGGRFHLPPENMLPDCPLHGTAAAKALAEPPVDRGPWKQTYTGRRFYVLDPRPEDFCLGDISHHLALVCRFGGSCKQFYSVAQHSVHVSERLEQLLEDDNAHGKSIGEPGLRHGLEDILVAAMHGLFHDGSVAYLGEVDAQVKCLPMMQPYRITEHLIQMLIFLAFRLPTDPVDELRLVDARMLMTEARDLKPPLPEPWPEEAQPYPEHISAWGPTVAEARFVDRFNEIEAKLRLVRDLPACQVMTEAQLLGAHEAVGGKGGGEP
jgi:hypothetical protein